MPTKKKTTRRQPYHGTQAVSRAVSILKAFENANSGLTAVQLAAILELNRSTVHRLLSVLEAEGLIARESAIGEARNSAYRLGPTLVSLGGLALRQINLRAIALPHLRQLAQKSGETVDLEILTGGEVMIVEEVPGEHMLRVGVGDNIGARYPAHTTSTGKLLLADLPDDELRDVLPAKLVALTPHTIADKQALRDELARVRQQGWAQSWEELELGLAAVGAPIRGRDGNVIAAVSVSGPTVRIDQAQIKHLTILVMDTCKRISRDVGFTRR
ncbi:MAG: IclR family transcriptional regulator [Chloroflexi bacterium]|nr:IclR family transcriptional regulator [Chloroflexota bacterium]